jgi:hypothetical protein
MRNPIGVANLDHLNGESTWQSSDGLKLEMTSRDISKREVKSRGIGFHGMGDGPLHALYLQFTRPCGI